MKTISDKRLSFLRCKQLRMSKVLNRVAGRRRNVQYNALIRIGERSRPVFVKAPRNFELLYEVHREDVLKFIRLMGIKLAEGRTIVIDFSATVKLHSCGMLYFLASLDCLLLSYPNKIRCKLPKEPVVEQLFQHVGLLARLGRSPRLVVTAENVVNWHYAYGVDATTSAFKALLVQHSEAMGGLVTRSSLYDCMSEAVTNTRKHAYPKVNVLNANGWWMFSKAENNQLEVVICDLGIGIPKSLLDKPEMRDYFRKLYMIGRASSHDKELIKIATSTTRSSTGLAYRGKGLPQMLDFIKQSSDGGFRAHSGSGVYAFSGAKQQDKSHTYRLPIKGTLIQWTLQLNS